MFSVLLSLYIKEQPSHLRKSLDSLFSQTLLPAEIILVKDGKLTPELNAVVSDYVQHYSILKVITLDMNQGLGKALNEGLKHCSYDLVARMDTDDIAKTNRFEKQLEILKNQPEIDIISSWIDEFEGDITQIISTRKVPEFHGDIYKYAKKRCPINHPAVMFRKSAVLAAGGYKHFLLFEDYYLWVRMLMNGAKFYNIQESLLYFRFSADMFKRRGGWNYAINEYKLQKEFKDIGFISNIDFFYNISVRFISRILPNKLRSILYKTILR
ncbi:glycosyltransferase family 2 protein [Parabacteroides goldsteinii]|uniref:Glycosyltransferase 2-like domain-containing protein n=1 Tax=Parabacteroides goldsteinii CL02T12C30 TaxID=999418 RepID=K5YQS4_9BACT|nr:glycosyltransferase [Parabacteroides goldsteinii]EKN16392.1 hypothetical protein HMPREF1076_01526 [Parabacteroides goldsteinii CL02T12C30]